VAQAWRVARTSSDRNRLPLDAAALQRLALTYVARYATTRARLGSYLRRKLRENGWAGDVDPDVDALVARTAQLGYVDDALYARDRASALERRGLGPRRIAAALRDAGIEAEETAAISSELSDNAWETALAFARRRRIGPFAKQPSDDRARRRGFAALIRAGHDPATARKIADAAPGELPEQWP